MKILASKTALVNREHLSIVFQMGGSNASIEGYEFWFFSFLKRAIVLHPFACRKSLYKEKLVYGSIWEDFSHHSGMIST